MLNIAHAAADAALAEQIKTDLMRSRIKLEHAVLIVLASPDSMQDDSIRQTIEQAKRDGQRVAVIQVKPVTVPDTLGTFPPLDLTGSYDSRKVIAHVNRVDMGMARIVRGRRWLALISAGAILMFFVAIWGILTRQVGFPVEEYATEYAIEQGQIETFAAPTLDFVMPRTTDQALNFALTVQVIPTRVRQFAIETATALPLGIEGTQNAIGTSAVGTSAAMTQQAP